MVDLLGAHQKLARRADCSRYSALDWGGAVDELSSVFCQSITEELGLCRPGSTMT